MRLTFVRAGTIFLSGSGADIRGKLENGLLEPLGIHQLASFLEEQNVCTQFVDLALYSESDHQRVVKSILDSQPDVIAFSLLFSVMEAHVQRWAKFLKDSGFKGHITAGGNKSTVAPKEVLANCPALDSVIVGDGEEPLAELVKAVNSEHPTHLVPGVFTREHPLLVRPAPHDLSSLPIPFRNPIYGELSGVACVQGSRGCQGSCTYCSIHAAHLACGGRSKWRGKEVSSILLDIEQAVNTLRTNEVWFVDENFIGPGEEGQQRTIDLCQKISFQFPKLRFVIQARTDTLTRPVVSALKKAGLFKVFLGVESGVESQLKRFAKGANAKTTHGALSVLDAHGIYSELGMIGFDPHVTRNEILDNVRFLEQLARSYSYPHIYAFNPLTPFSGTVIHKLLKQEGLISYPPHQDDPSCIYKDVAIGAMASHIFDFYAVFGNLSETIRHGMSTNKDMRPLMRDKNMLFCKLLGTFIQNCIRGVAWDFKIKPEIREMEEKWEIRNEK